MGINSVLCFIVIQVIIIYQQEGPLLTHLMIDIDIVSWEESSRWQAVFFISIVDRVNYRDRLKSNRPFVRPPPTAKFNLALHQTPHKLTLCQTSPYSYSQSEYRRPEGCIFRMDLNWITLQSVGTENPFHILRLTTPAWQRLILESRITPHAILLELHSKQVA
jgi:hypothetical protein